MQEKDVLRGACLLSCAKNGYISIKKAEKKLGWSKHKIISVGNLLATKGILTQDCRRIAYGCFRLDGYYIASF